MKVARLVYIASTGVPTATAHGHGMTKMCEAFATHGLEVELWRPFRRRYLHKKTEDIFSFYDIDRTFTVRTIGTPKRPETAFVRFAHACMKRTSIWGAIAARRARSFGADLYFTRDPSIAWWLLRSGVPTVYEAHDVPWRWGRRMARGLRGRNLVRAIGLTPHIRDDLATLGIPGDKLTFLPNGVDIERFEALPSSYECRIRTGLPQDRQVVGYVGRFRLEAKNMEKGIPELVRAMAMLEVASEDPPLLACVGGPMDAVGSYREVAREAGLDEQRLLFVDRVPPSEVPYWIRACDVLTIPSTRTPFSEFFTSPLKLFEYMAAGAAIVATDLPSVREFLVDRENALMVAPDDPAALAEAISLLLNDDALRRKLATNIRARSSSYSWRARTATILRFAAEH